MDSKTNDEFVDIPWDSKSEQPHVIRHRRSLAMRIRYAYKDYLKSSLTALLYSPVILATQIALTLGYRPSKWKTPKGNGKEFAGLAVALESCDGPTLAKEINALGVKHILLRIPVWEINKIGKYIDFLERIPDCEVIVCIMQTRKDVIDHEHWHKNMETIVQSCWPRVKHFQIGQGVNRSKWGFFSTGEFLAFANVAEDLRDTYEGIQLVGPSILDFESIPLIRAISHGFRLNWDVVGCALYVDRRGSPRNRQLLFFDLIQKIYHFVACIRFSTKAKQRFWITEVNWPLSGNPGYSPTTDYTQVDEESAGKYLTEYYEDAWATQLVERVYWWQLVAKGFGLIDPMDDGTLRKRPAYYAFKAILEQSHQKETELTKPIKTSETEVSHIS
ncbi:hypothetical protein MLD52_20030 [Puniceicoccaceae bacterium K14]|nr:hypothetical protein [Puniceicoccaceae bacterium K14]